MLDQNTDRMWYVIGAVLIGAAIIFGMNTLMPETFASIGGMVEQTVREINIEDMFDPNVLRMSIEHVQTREDASIEGVENRPDGRGSGLLSSWDNHLVINFDEAHDGTYGYGSDFVFWFNSETSKNLPEFEYIELRFDVKSNNKESLGMRTGSNILSQDHYRISTSNEWTTIRKIIPYSMYIESTNPRGALVLWSENPSIVEIKNFSVHLRRDG